MQDVAELSGLSRFTVSKVLNGTAGVSDDTKALVLAACEKLSFVPNRHAASLAKGGAQLLGLVVTSIVDPFYGEIIETAERTASASGFELAFRCSYGSAEQERHIAHNFLGLKAGALIVSAASSNENAEFWRALSQKIPVVFIDHVLLESSHVVMTDHYRGARLVTEHLLELGAPPAYLGSSQPLSNSAIAARRAGYLDAMKAAGEPARLLDTLEGEAGGGLEHEPAAEHPRRWADNERFGFAATARALVNGELASVRALACATDAIALGAMKALSESGLQPGRDILVAGHDDLPFSAFVEPSLTTVRQPKQDIGEQAVEAAMRLTSAKDFRRVPKVRQVLAPELIVRDSTMRRS